MPPAQSNFVQKFHRYSAEADAIAASASDEKTKAEYSEIARRWLAIALSYESRHKPSATPTNACEDNERLGGSLMDCPLMSVSSILPLAGRAALQRAALHLG